MHAGIRGMGGIGKGRRKGWKGKEVGGEGQVRARIGIGMGTTTKPPNEIIITVCELPRGMFRASRLLDGGVTGPQLRPPPR